MSNVPSQIDPLDPSAAAVEKLAEADAHAGHRAQRLHRLKLSIASSLLIRPLSILIPLIAIPLFLDYLGRERYGLYESIGALALYMGMANAGLTLGLINQLTECDVTGDRQMARRYTSTLALAMFIFSILSTVILTVVALTVDWQRVFAAEDPTAQRETPWAFWFAGLCVIGGLLSGIAPAIYTAYQETHRNNVWEGISKVLSLAACFAVVLTQWGIVGVIIALSGVPTLVRLVNIADMFLREKPWLRPHPSLFDFTLLKRMAAHGILLFCLQMSVVLLFQTDKLIIGIVLTPGDVTGYAIVGRIFLTAYGLYMMLLTPLWPASGEALRRGDIAWVRKGLRLTILVGCALMLLCGLVLTIGGNWLIGLLPNSEGITVSRWLILGITCTFITRAWVDGRSVVLNSANILVPQVFFYGGQAVLNVLLAIFMARRFGVEGVAWATPITAMLTTVWGYWWMTHRYIFSAGPPPSGPQERGFEVVTQEKS